MNLPFQHGFDLWTLDDPLGPKASPTGGELVPKAILFIRVQIMASSTGIADGELKLIHSLPKRSVFLAVPDAFQTVLPNIPQSVLANLSLDAVQIGGIVVQQPHTGRYCAIRPNNGAPFPYKTAALRGHSSGVPHKPNIPGAFKRAIERLNGGVIPIHPGEHQLEHSAITVLK